MLDGPVSWVVEWSAFAAVIALGQFSPGPDMMLLTRTALREGPAAGFRMAAGISCGLLVHATLAVAGMAVMFQRFPVLRAALQWLAAGYLAWLALRIARERFVIWYSGAVLENASPAGTHPPFLRGLLCNLFNPKVAIFLAAVCAPFLAGRHPKWWPFAIWATIVGLGLGLWALWVLLLQWKPLRHSYEVASGWIDAVFAVLLFGLAIRLALAG